MEHTMKLYKENFERLTSGNKKREYRLYDEKRQKVRIGDTIIFKELPDLNEEYTVDVENIEIFDTWYDAYSQYFEEDFKNRYANVDEVVEDTFNSGCSTKEESEKYKVVVFTIKKHRISHYNSTACYLRNNEKVLMIKFNKKWGNVYAPPGGKFETGESPLDCIMREFKEETGLTLIKPKLQGISYWKDSVEGIIYIFTAEAYSGVLTTSGEGNLEWINISELESIFQFDQNTKFTPYLFKKELFEGKFTLDNKCKVLDYEIRKI